MPYKVLIFTETLFCSKYTKNRNVFSSCTIPIMFKLLRPFLKVYITLKIRTRFGIYSIKMVFRSELNYKTLEDKLFRCKIAEVQSIR